MKRDLSKLKAIQNKQTKSSRIDKVQKRILDSLKRSNLSEEDILYVLKTGRMSSCMNPLSYPKINFTGEKVKFGVFSDTHIGSIFFQEEWFKTALQIFIDTGCEFVLHAGDIFEGHSNRAGHCYECSHIGYKRQKDYGYKLFRDFPLDMYVIDGNHDRWYIKSSGALIVEDLCKELPKMTFLGSDIGYVDLKKHARILLWHGEDGSSYATSYRYQKIIESLTGGHKPNIMIGAHVHKMIYLFSRHVHIVGSGACSAQSNWMRAHRIENHAGFWVVETCINKDGIARFKPEWYPFYG